MPSNSDVLPTEQLEIPGKSIVSVSVINTTATLRGVPTWKFFEPAIEGHEWLATPCYSFLIEHRDIDSGAIRRLVFDLGIRKDWENLSPFLQRRFKTGGYQVSVEKSVRDILEENGVDCTGEAIEAIIWSHWHFDHTGNPGEFPGTTKLIVGPGFKNHLLPGYPANPESSILESDYSGRPLQEIDFGPGGLQIGGFDSYNYFGDGSFYLLDAPGHAIGHLCGLARVSKKPDSYIFMGGDISHHPGEWRPSQLLPLPAQIDPSPFPIAGATAPICPGSLFEQLGQPNSTSHGRTETFYKPAKLETGQIHHDVDVNIGSIQKMQKFDGSKDENIMVCVAHDESLLDSIDFFPMKVNNFLEKGWVSKLRWRFLRDFAKAVDRQDQVAEKRDWAPL